jgi:hypothetical protein
VRINNLLIQAVKLVPDVLPYLTDKTRFALYEPAAYKSFEYMLKQIEGLVRGVYNGNIGGQFIDTMANLISGQLTQAYNQAFEDEGFTDEALPEYLTSSLEEMILGQYKHVDQYYRDIVDARVDGTPLEPLLSRAQMWANQWNTAYQKAVELIRLEGGGNLEWVKGATEKGCKTCADLDGFVMSAKEWQALDLHPRGYPNPKLECGGGGPANNCDCELVPTDKRRSPNAYGRIEEILLGR